MFNMCKLGQSFLKKKIKYLGQYLEHEQINAQRLHVFVLKKN